MTIGGHLVLKSSLSYAIMGRHILDARVRDIEKRRLPSKHYVYVIHVSWTDGSVTIIYRRYSKFFDFHMKLLATFPDEAGSRIPSQRTIPFLPGKKVFGRSHTREVALKRMNQLDEYCRLLVKMPGKISNSEEVITFFSPTPEDINPPTSSDTSSHSSSSEIDEISDPIQAEQYKVIADYKKQQKNEVDLVSGDVVEVFEKNENGWWFVSVQDSQGWAPGTFLTKADGREEEEESIAGNNESYITNNSYKAKLDDELSFETGVVVTVLKKSLDGWWQVRYLDKDGWVPATYLQPYKGPELIHSSPTEFIGNVMNISNLTLTDSPQTERTNKFQQAKTGRAMNKRFNTDAKPTPPRRSTVKKSMKNNIPRERKKSQYKTTASFDGSSTSDDCVSFEANQMVEVIHKYEEWWLIKINGHEGWAPASFIEACNSHSPTPSEPTWPSPIDPHRGGSNISTDSETGAPRGPESNKYRPPNTTRQDNQIGRNGGAFQPYRPDPPKSRTSDHLPQKPAASDGGHVSDLSRIKQNLRPASGAPTGTGGRPPMPKPKPSNDSTAISKLRAQLESSIGSSNSPPKPAVPRKPNSNKMIYKTLAPFDGEEELSFEEGVEVEVIEKNDSGWWLVRIGNEEGWAPSTYLEPLS